MNIMQAVSGNSTENLSGPLKIPVVAWVTGVSGFVLTVSSICLFAFGVIAVGALGASLVVGAVLLVVAVAYVLIERKKSQPVTGSNVPQVRSTPLANFAAKRKEEGYVGPECNILEITPEGECKMIFCHTDAHKHWRRDDNLFYTENIGECGQQYPGIEMLTFSCELPPDFSLSGSDFPNLKCIRFTEPPKTFSLKMEGDFDVLEEIELYGCKDLENFTLVAGELTGIERFIPRWKKFFFLDYRET
ncbi:MAG: hypothetical protein LBS68_03050 [Puniceicoccales bacterium]|jgi:hypothetical protein|nr:hypothetical protein [Puniceicoccales bacterium]